MNCYIPDASCNAVAAKVKGWSPFTVATLRGMYDDAHPSDHLDMSDPDRAAKTLAMFKRTLIQNAVADLSNSSGEMAGSFIKIREAFPSAQTRYNRVRLIAEMFSMVVDSIQKNAGVQLSRTQICNGEDPRFGEGQIFGQVYNGLMSRYAKCVEAKDYESAEKIQAVLDNFGALCSYARVVLRDTEGIKLGHKIEYALEADLYDFSDNNLAELYDPNETVRESWQNGGNDLVSAFGTVSKSVRRILSMLYEVDGDGNIVIDDLGRKQTANPVLVHQEILSTLKGVKTESDMVAVLEKSKLPYKNQLLNFLRESPEVRTQFCVDMHKNYQVYGELSITPVNKGDKRTYKFKTYIKNRFKNLLERPYAARVRMGKTVGNNSVYDTTGKVDWKNLQALRSLIKEYFSPETTTFGGQVSTLYNGKGKKFFTLGSAEKVSVLIQASQALGIDLDKNTATRIVSNKKALNEYTRNLQELVVTNKGQASGFDAVLFDATRKKLDEGDYSLPPASFSELLTKQTKSQEQTNSKQGNIEEKVRKMLNVVAQQREAFRMESKVVRKIKGKSKTFYSHVNPDFLGDWIENINYLAENNRQGLLNMIEEKYLGSSMFRLNGRILNRWLSDICNETGEDSLGEKITYKRFLGNENADFEDFTTKQHALQMMNEYFFAENDKDKNGKKYGWYPVFILGDSGVAKYIKAKRYGAAEIIDGLYDVYCSECQRNILVEAANKSLKDRGYKTIDNIKTDSFALLPFLNDEKYRPEGPQESWTEADVKGAIQKYMKDAVEDYKAKLESTGALEKTGDGSYTYFDELLKANPEYEGNIDKLISDFYWNTKFATIQQFQLMTVDAAFYKDTKDLQKRYKEIHAPGTAISVEAIDKYAGTDADGRPIPFSKDGIERVIYFDDPIINAEQSNPEFMNAILYQHAAPNKRDEALQAIKDGITTPKDDPEEEQARIEKIKDILGDSYEIYKAYTKNVLADGQGYRTLESYRKVKGMAGQWTEEDQRTYERIQQIRNELGENGAATAEMIDELSALSSRFMPIKPYMFTFEKFDKKLEIGNGQESELLIPVQHKYAEVVLIPELLPEGSKLKHMALWMEKNNVDVAGAWSKGGDKIVKVGGFGSTSIEEANTQDAMNEALGKAFVHELPYSDYRIQTNVPEHINSSQLFGTQLRKIIMAGIQMDSDRYANYIDGQQVNIMGRMTTLNGRNLINLYNSLIVANILDSWESFEKEISNNQQLSDMLQQAIINNDRESIDNILAVALDPSGEFHMPLFEGGMEHDTAAMLLSIFKKRVNKQRINGGSAVQASALGIYGKTTSEDLKYVTDDNNNILYAEVEMPFDLSVNVGGRSLQLKYSDYCNADGSLIMDGEVSKLEKHFPGILDRVCYRIPTERHYSMMRVKIVRFSAPTAGGTIKVPAQGTTQAGFDFDIDKLYFMMREYHTLPFTPEQVGEIWRDIYKANPDIKNKLEQARTLDTKGKDFLDQFMKVFGSSLASSIKETNAQVEAKDALVQYWTEAGLPGTPSEYFDRYVEERYEHYMAKYDLSKSVLEQSTDKAVARAVRNNQLIDLVQKRLEDQETFKYRTMPGGFEDYSAAARQMRELLYADESEITESGRVNFDAVDRRSAQKSLDPEPNYDPSDPATILTYNQMNQVAGKMIGIFANQNTNHAFASLMSEFSLNTPIEFCGHSYKDLLHAPDGTDPAHNVAELVAASVDAVKDPVLNYLNLNTITGPAAGMLARLGYTAFEIGLLFNQPIIKEACELSFNNDVDISKSIQTIVEKYTTLIEAQGGEVGDGKKVDPSYFSKDALATMIVRTRNGKELTLREMQHQMQVLSLFQNILNTASEINDFVASTKFTASNAVGSTFGDMYAQQMRVTKYVSGLAQQGKNVHIKVADGVYAPVQVGTMPSEKEQYLTKVCAQGLGNPFAYEQAMFDMNRRCVESLSKHFPYETEAYKGARNFAADCTKMGTLQASTINEIHSEMLCYMLAQHGGLFDGNGDAQYYNENHEHEELTRKDYYLKKFPEQLYRILEDRPELKKEYAILEYMTFQSAEIGGSAYTEMQLQEVGGYVAQQKEQIKESWASLLLTEPNIAVDLFMYCYYKNGFGFSPKSFMHLAPVAVKDAIVIDNQGTTYTQFLRKVLDGNISVDAAKFLKQFIVNHLDEKAFIYKVREGKIGGEIDNTLRRLTLQNGRLVQTFTINEDQIGKDRSLIVTPSTKDTEATWVPCIVTPQGAVYMADNDSFNVGDIRTMRYRYVGMESEFRTLSYSQDGSTSVGGDTPVIQQEPSSGIDVHALAEAMVRREIERGALVQEDASAAIKQFEDAMAAALQQGMTMEDLIANAKQQCQTNEFKDKEGNKIC